MPTLTFYPTADPSARRKPAHQPLQQQPRRVVNWQQQQQGSTDYQQGRPAGRVVFLGAGRDEHPQRDTHGPSNPDGREHAGIRRPLDAPASARQMC